MDTTSTTHNRTRRSHSPTALDKFELFYELVPMRTESDTRKQTPVRRK